MQYDDPTLMKLAEYNQQVRDTFEIVEVPHDHVCCQYFVMYGSEEGEAFNPEHIHGVSGTGDMANVISHYRQTGVLKLPEQYYTPWLGRTYKHVQPKWVYFLKSEAAMYKLPKMEVVETLS